MNPATGAARKPAEPRPMPIIRPRPEEAPSGTASIMEAYITGKGELRKMPQPISMIQPRAPLLINIMSRTVTAQPTASIPRDHFLPWWSETVPQKIWPIHPVMPEAPATTEAAASERPASLVSCNVRNVITPVSAHKNRKLATTESRTLREVSASLIASHAVATGSSSRSSDSGRQGRLRQRDLRGVHRFILRSLRYVLRGGRQPLRGSLRPERRDGALASG